MSDNAATVQQPPYVYGNVLLRTIYEPQSLEPSRLGRCLSQGAATGAVIAFLFCLILAGLSGNPYLGLILPFLQVIGIILGLFQGLVVWGWMRLAEHHLSWGYRVAIGVLTATMFVLLWFWIWVPRLTDHLLPLAIYFSICIALSLAAGSVLQPWRELVRGAEAMPQQWRPLTGITGFFLRVVVVFFLMESTLATIVNLQLRYSPKELAFELTALVHCIAAFAIVVARLRFWLLLPLALLVNAPVVLWLTKVTKDFDVFWFYLVIGYLALWTVFLLSRWSGTYSALAIFKDELRYYLID